MENVLKNVLHIVIVKGENMRTIYLDQAATSSPKLEVIEAMMPYLSGDKWHNPSSLYSAGANVKEDIENARKIVADYIGADASEIYFTSGGSESNCMALRGFIDNVIDNGYRPVIITSSIEHKSVLSCVRAIAGNGVDIIELDVDDKGFIDVDELEKFLNPYGSITSYKVLVSIQFANNEIGSVQPIKEISEVVHHYGATLHVDAVQAIGQITIDVKKLGIDMMSVSGHKIGTPKGVGFLYKENGVEIAPLIFGSQEGGLRGGTENVPYIMGMAKAVELLNDNWLKKAYVANYRDYLIKLLEDIGCKLIGSREHRLPNNINIMLPEGVGAEETMLMLDMSGVMCSTGSACNSRMVEPSHVLKAIGLTNEEAARCIRLTLSDDITIDEIDYVVEEIKKCIKLLGGIMENA